MGFAVSPNGLGVGTGPLTQCQQFSTTTVTPTAPAGMVAGDLVLIFVWGRNATSAITATGGSGTWSQYGSTQAQADIGGKTAIFYRTIATDNESMPLITCTGATGFNWYCATIVRSDAASGATLMSNVTSTNKSNSVASTTWQFPSAAPTADFDLRLWFACGPVGAFAGAFPTVSPVAKNPWAYTGQGLGGNGETSIGSRMALFGAWVPASEYDTTNPFNVTTMGSAKSFIQSMIFTDGSGYNGGGPARVEELFWGDPNIKAQKLERDDDIISAAAGRFGGGAHIL